ncbi:MAG: DUF4054 domain-containing protein [Gemmatimonadota bacterium]|nr:DUF4054 domain-containing protein [Gemmatimonadota bacterium]
MPTPTRAEFREQFPSVDSAALSDDDLDRLIAEAVQIHSVRKLATLYLVAHLYELERQASGGTVTKGEVKSEGVGPIRVSYVTQAQDGQESFFTSTRYGQRFLALERRTPSLIATARVVG